jgi:hypothetical protein
LLNDYLPATVLTPELYASGVDAEKMSLTYDFCIMLSSMRQKLKHFQQEALKADRSERRELVLASKRSEKGIASSLQPAVSSLSLLNKLSDELWTWLSAQTYVLSESQVRLETLLANCQGHWQPG